MAYTTTTQCSQTLLPDASASHRFITLSSTNLYGFFLTDFG